MKRGDSESTLYNFWESAYKTKHSSRIILIIFQYLECMYVYTSMQLSLFTLILRHYIILVLRRTINTPFGYKSIIHFFKDTEIKWNEFGTGGIPTSMALSLLGLITEMIPYIFAKSMFISKEVIQSILCLTYFCFGVSRTDVDSQATHRLAETKAHSLF